MSAGNSSIVGQAIKSPDNRLLNFALIIVYCRVILSFTGLSGFLNIYLLC